MKVLALEAHNVLRLSDVKFDLEGRHLFLVGGKNGQGKTSTLIALLMALCGPRGMDNYPEVALKEGEEKGWVKVKLSGDDEIHEPVGLTVELFLRRKRGGVVAEEFRILDSSGEEAPEPRTLLKRLCEVRAFDPLSFERLDKKGKAELLKKMLGLDFSAEDKEYQKAYDERTVVNRDGIRTKAQLDGLKRHEDAPTEELVTADLLAELDRRQHINQANRKEREALNSAKRLATNCEEGLLNAQRELVAAQVKVENAKKAHETALKAAELAEAKVSTLVDASEKEVRDQIAGADAANAKVRSNRKYDETKAEVDSLRSRSEALSRRLGEITEQKAQKLKEAKWPVPGLALDDQGVLYKGLPFEQASKSQRVIISTEIGMSLNPKLRLLVSESGGDLDTETIAALDQLLREKGFQMLVEIVTRTSADEDLCAVIIQDGAIRQELDAAEAA